MNRSPAWIAAASVLALLALLVASTHAQAPQPNLAQPSASIDTAFTYQGQLKRGGALVSDLCTFQFSLWATLTGGGQRGDTVTIDNVTVADGLFTVRLDFGNQYFGEDRWLHTAVKCAGDTVFTQLDPRTPLTAVPYASSLRPGVHTVGSTEAGTAIIRGENRGQGVGVWGEAIGSSDAGVYGFSSHGPGLWGFTSLGASAVYGHTNNPAPGSAGVRGEAHEPGGIGVRGATNRGDAGVYGETGNPSGSGVYGRANGGNAAGVYGRNAAGAGVWGFTPVAASGVYGESAGVGGRGVYGVATAAGGMGVRGQADGGAQAFGVYGSSTTNHGVAGFSYAPAGAGVLGESPFIGVQGATSGVTNNHQGVRGIAPAGSAAWAGYFDGKAGAKNGFHGPFATTQIDHPLDPADKVLSHAFVQSPDLKSIYDGVVTTDAAGLAVVDLPPYVEALNTDFRYQLTVIKQFAQAIIADELHAGRFTIQTDRPFIKVSWQLTGIRKDGWAIQNPLQVEALKPAADRGRYLHPEAFGAPPSTAVARHQPSPLHRPDPAIPLGPHPAALADTQARAHP